MVTATVHQAHVQPVDNNEDDADDDAQQQQGALKGYLIMNITMAGCVRA